MTETETLRKQIQADINGLRWILDNTNDTDQPAVILREIARHKSNMLNLQHQNEKEVA